MNPFSPANFTVAAPCLPCCGAACACILFIPPQSDPYSDYATAQAAITDNTGDCLAYYVPNGTTGNSITASFDGTDFDVTNTTDGVFDVGSLNYRFDIETWVGVGLSAGSILSMNFSLSAADDWSVHAYLYNCAGVLVDEDSAGSQTGTLHLDAPTDDGYTVKVTVLAVNTTPENFQTDLGFTSDGAMVANPIVALWDDSGTTRQLEACPKLYLPILTESTGDWFADCASAAVVLTGDRVSACVGYYDGIKDPDAFTATDGGTSLTLDYTRSVTGFPGDWFNGYLTGIMYGSINVEAGETISAAFIRSSTNVDSGYHYHTTLRVFDSSGAMVDEQIDDSTATSQSATLTSIAMPATGRYTVYVSTGPEDNGAPYNPSGLSATSTASFVITSSGTLTVNPIQALYDTGLTCPSRLNCGDTCP